MMMMILIIMMMEVEVARVKFNTEEMAALSFFIHRFISGTG